MPRFECEDREIKARLEAQAEAVALALVPDAMGYFDRGSGHYKPRNPTRADRRPGSFVINVGRTKPGHWRDFATGEFGDIISLIGLALGFDASTKDGYPRALEWAAQFLGIGLATGGSSGPAFRPAMRPDNGAGRSPAPTSGGGSAFTPDKARGQWLGGAMKADKARSDLTDTAVGDYLWHREIDLKAILKSAAYAPALGALRFHPKGRYYHGGGLENWTEHPVMVAAMTSAENKIVALHRTFLAAGGAGKADVPSPKKMRGPTMGAAIRLWRGASGLSVDRAAAKGIQETVVTVEGIEDGLAAIEVWPDYRVRAAGSLGNFDRLDWPACCDRMILIGDNDHSEQAVAAWTRTVATYEAMAAARRGQGMAARVVPFKPPPHVKDLNDWLADLKTQDIST